MHDAPMVTALADEHALLPAKRMSLLRFITCGSVDDGKSTLIGRLLHDTRSIPDDQLDRLSVDSRRWGTQEGAIDYALLLVLRFHETNHMGGIPPAPLYVVAWLPSRT